MPHPTADSRSSVRRTLGPMAYVMPIMPAVLIFGPIIMVIPMQSIIATVMALILGITLGALWMSVMRLAQRLIELEADAADRTTSAAQAAAPLAGDTSA